MKGNRDILFVVNPISGKGRKAEIIDMLRSRGYEVALTAHAGHAEEIARNTSFGTVVAVGGDGTVNEVARGLMGTGKTMGVLPCGSGDGLALCLGISRNPLKALETIEKGRTVPLDCAQIDGRVFVSVSGVGFDAFISMKFAESGSRGLMTYIRESAKAWWGYNPEEYTLEYDGKRLTTKALLITVSNSDQWGNGARINPLASVGDGWLDVAVVQKFPLFELPVLAWRLFRGKIHKSSCVESFRCREISICRKGGGPAHFDGDFFIAPALVKIGFLPEKLRIIVP